MDGKTHWKKMFNYDYLGAYSLENGDMTLTIKHVKKEPVKGDSGRSEDCVVCHFVENQKPMILNRTNCKTIGRIYKTSYIEDWAGKQITLYVLQGVKAFGDIVDALRVRPKIPSATLPLFDQSHAGWDKAVSLLASGGSIAKIKTKYSITKQVEENLLFLAETKKGEKNEN